MSPLILLIIAAAIVIGGWLLYRHTVVEISAVELSPEERKLIVAELHFGDIDLLCDNALEQTGAVPADLAERRSAAELNIALARTALYESERRASKPAATEQLTPVRSLTPARRLPLPVVLQPAALFTEIPADKRDQPEDAQ